MATIQLKIRIVKSRADSGHVPLIDFLAHRGFFRTHEVAKRFNKNTKIEWCVILVTIAVAFGKRLYFLLSLHIGGNICSVFSWQRNSAQESFAWGLQWKHSSLFALSKKTRFSPNLNPFSLLRILGMYKRQRRFFFVYFFPSLPVFCRYAIDWLVRASG